MGGPKVAEDYGKICLPFFSRKFFETCIQIPIKERTGYKLYKKILEKYHPISLKIPSTSIKSGKEVLWISKISEVIAKLKLYALRAMERVLRVHLIRTDTYIQPNKWIRKNKEYRDMFMSILLDETTEKRGIFDVPEIKKMFKEHLAFKHNYGFIFTRLLDFELTMRLFVDKDEDLIIQADV
jgi:hypothetical protein